MDALTNYHRKHPYRVTRNIAVDLVNEIVRFMNRPERSDAIPNYINNNNARAVQITGIHLKWIRRLLNFSSFKNSDVIFTYLAWLSLLLSEYSYLCRLLCGQWCSHESEAQCSLNESWLPSTMTLEPYNSLESAWNESDV
jgi:hypothetical protein